MPISSMAILSYNCKFMYQLGRAEKYRPWTLPMTFAQDGSIEALLAVNFNLWPEGQTHPRIIMTVSQHKITNLLKTWRLFSSVAHKHTKCPTLQARALSYTFCISSHLPHSRNTRVKSPSLFYSRWTLYCKLHEARDIWEPPLAFFNPVCFLLGSSTK